MKITIEAQDMLEVLIQAGIDTTDAKAIIYDLLQLPEGGREKLIDAKRRRREKAKDVKQEFVEEEFEEVEEALEKSDSTGKKPKRVNFSNFGGVAEPLR